jgi:hypothetical protein
MPSATALAPWPMAPQTHTLKGTHFMLMNIAIILVILWIFGLVTSSTLGGFIHVLLVVALVILIVRFIQGRRVL